MFDDKSLIIKGKPTTIRDDFGIVRTLDDGINTNYECDIQPISHDRTVKDFGIDSVCKYRIFLDSFVQIEIEINDIVIIGEFEYKVLGLLKWDSYYDFVVGDI